MGGFKMFDHNNPNVHKVCKGDWLQKLNHDGTCITTVQVRDKRPTHTPNAHTIFAQTPVKKRVPQHAFACIWCACFLLLFTTVLCVAFFYTTKEQDKRQFPQTPLRNISAEKQTAEWHGVGVQSLNIDKCPTFTQIFLSWTKCKRKQSQSSFPCFISLWCCGLNLLSFAGLARNKLREKFTLLTEILVHGVTFQRL